MAFKKTKAVLIAAGIPTLTAAFLTASAHFIPELSNSSARDYLAENNSSLDIFEQNYNLDRIRVYDTKSPMFIFNQIGHSVRYYIDQKKSGNHATIGLLASEIVQNLKRDVPIYLSGTSAPYANPQKDYCYVLPVMHSVSLRELAAGASGIRELQNAESLKISVPEDELLQALVTIIDAHEFHHCEQPPNVMHGLPTLRESDADIKAMKVFQQSGFDEDVKQEAYKLMLALRIVGFFSNGPMHDTASSLMDGEVELFSTVQNTHDHEEVVKLMRAVSSMHSYPPEMAPSERMYHTAQALLFRGVLQNSGEEVSSFTASYLKAYEYLNEIADNALIKFKGFGEGINVNSLLFKTDQKLDPEMGFENLF